MGVLRHKIWYDLWKNKGRTMQVVLIVGMGAFAVGMIISTRMLVIPGMEDIWRDASAPMIYLGTNPSVDDDTIRVLQRIEGLEDVEGYAFTNVEWRSGPDDEWSSAFLMARDDYEDQTYIKLGLLSGEWPQGKTFAVSQGVDVAYGIQEGGQVTIRVADREHVVEIGGVVYDPIAQPPGYGGPTQFFTTRDRLDYLTGDRNFNRILAAAPQYDEATLTDLASQMQNKLENQGVDSSGAAPMTAGLRTRDPKKHFFQDTMDAIFFIMGIMSILGLMLALFLVYNTINAIISQQVEQIGVMKAIGAKTGQILRLYLATVFVYGVLALLIAVPLGAIGGRGISVFLMNTFDAELGPFTIVPEAIVAQVAIALLTPLLISLIPVFSGARITVREAISSYGLSAGAGLLDRLLAKAKRIPRLVSLTISNTFRNKGRVFLTQITLVLSGLIFMMVISVRDSTVYTFSDVMFSINNFDVFFSFKNLERIDRVEALALAHPDVKAAEMWYVGGAEIRPADQPELEDDRSVALNGVPLPTTLYVPQIRAGRWLLPEDGYAVVLDHELAEEIGVGVGDWVTLDHGSKGESTWQIVGLLFDPGGPNSIHVPRDVLLKELGTSGRASTIYFQTVRDGPAGEEAAAKSLRQYYKQLQLDTSPSIIDTASGFTASILSQVGMIISLLAVMAIIVGLVGSMALSGVLSLSVLERRREIGVMRAIGAPSGAIARLFIGEGMILGWLSWVIALPLSIPAGQLMNQGLGGAFNAVILYKFIPTGPIYWLVIITILSIVAS
ncbi:MAG: ABC transporter permease, partial [Gammaproteobacteria bacterium]